MFRRHEDRTGEDIVEKYAQRQENTPSRSVPKTLEEIRRVLGNIEAIDFGPDSRPGWFKPSAPAQQ